MVIELRPLTASDAAAHCAGEDDLTVRWLTGGYGDVDGTIEYFAWLQANSDAGTGKRGFGVWADDRLCGYIDFNPDVSDGIEADDVNVSYAIHPWARGQGVAVAALDLLADHLRAAQIGRRLAIRVEPENAASVRVAEKAGFSYRGDFASATDVAPDGGPATLSLYVREL